MDNHVAAVPVRPTASFSGALHQPAHSATKAGKPDGRRSGTLRLNFTGPDPDGYPAAAQAIATAIAAQH